MGSKMRNWSCELSLTHELMVLGARLGVSSQIWEGGRVQRS